MKTSMKQLAFVLLALFFVTACNNAKKDKDVIKVGAIFPLTGKFAEMGEPLKFATQLAVEDINKAGGINAKEIEVIFEDSKGDAKTAVTAVQKLITVDKINIITSFLTGVSEAIKPITERNNVLFLAQTVAPKIIDNTLLTIRFHYSFMEEGLVMSKFITDKKPKKLAIIQSNDPSTSFELDSIIIPRLNEYNIEYTQDKFSVGNKDFASIALKVKNNSPDLIYISGYGTDIPPLLKELKNYGLTDGKVEICGNIGFIELPSNTQFELYDNVVFTCPSFILDSATIERANFEKRYKEISKKDFIGYAAYYAYDLIHILSEVLKVTNSTEASILRKNFIGKYTGIGGDYKITKNGDVIPEVVLGKYINNNITKY